MSKSFFFCFIIVENLRGTCNSGLWLCGLIIEPKLEFCRQIKQARERNMPDKS